MGYDVPMKRNDFKNVHDQVVGIGDIGIFMVNTECFIKEAERDGLISYNKKYHLIPDSEYIISLEKCWGK